MVLSHPWGGSGCRQVQQAGAAETFLHRPADPPKLLARNAGARNPDEIPPPGDPGPQCPHRLTHSTPGTVPFHRAPDFLPFNKAATRHPLWVGAGRGIQDQRPGTP